MDTLELDSKAPGKRGGVSVAASPEPSAPGQDTKPLTLVQRMAAVRSECDGLGKEDIKMQNKERTKEWTIKGHTIEGVLQGVRGLFDRHRIWVNPNLVSVSHNGNRCDVVVDFEWENLDDPTDRRTIRWAGSDTDLGGKGFAKAGTNALKEMLKKTFLITDREDAKEETEAVEHVTEDSMARERVKAAEDKAASSQAAWAKTLKTAIENVKTVQALKLLKRENSLKLSELPAVTRAFFEDLYAARLKELAPTEPEADERDADVPGIG